MMPQAVAMTSTLYVPAGAFMLDVGGGVGGAVVEPPLPQPICVATIPATINNIISFRQRLRAGNTTTAKTIEARLVPNTVRHLLLTFCVVAAGGTKACTVSVAVPFPVTLDEAGLMEQTTLADDVVQLSETGTVAP